MYSNVAATNNLLHRTFVDNPNFTVSSDLSFDFSQALAKNCSWVIEQEMKVVLFAFITLNLIELISLGKSILF